MNLTGLQFLDEMEVADKSVFLRADLNVPLRHGVISDDFRIRKALPTISHILENGGKLIIGSHLGRPKGQRVETLSMDPVGAKLAELLGCEVVLPHELMDSSLGTLVAEMKSGQVMLLENLRFHPGETAGDAEFANHLASLADCYVNDAFGAVHRGHASVYQMVEHFDRHSKASGFLVRDEVSALSRLVDNPTPPFVAVLGGAKVSDKIGILSTLVDVVDAIVIGGAMAYTFLQAEGVQVGSSLVEPEQIEIARKIIERARVRNTGLHLPTDHVVARHFDTSSPDDVAIVKTIDAGWQGLDIGPSTRERYRSVIASAKTVFWNGPMGVFENPLFCEGTNAVAGSVAESDGYSVVGGGDSASAIRAAGMVDTIDHVSTGGGASLEFVQGKSLPGIEALRPNHPFESFLSTRS
jgi:phosphoglycerate kinase